MQKDKDRMKQNTILQKAWVWNESVTNFVKDKIKGYSLNVCAGKNPLCNINLDLNPQDKTVIKGDMKLLKFKSNTFDTVCFRSSMENKLL